MFTLFEKVVLFSIYLLSSFAFSLDILVQGGENWEAEVFGPLLSAAFTLFVVLLLQHYKQRRSDFNSIVDNAIERGWKVKKFK